MEDVFYIAFIHFLNVLEYVVVGGWMFGGGSNVAHRPSDLSRALEGTESLSSLIGAIIGKIFFVADQPTVDPHLASLYF